DFLVIRGLFMVTSIQLPQSCIYTQSQMDLLSPCFTYWRIKINTDKCEAICFTWKDYGPVLWEVLTIQGEKLHWTKLTRYLVLQVLQVGADQADLDKVNQLAVISQNTTRIIPTRSCCFPIKRSLGIPPLGDYVKAQAFLNMLIPGTLPSEHYKHSNINKDSTSDDRRSSNNTGTVAAVTDVVVVYIPSTKLGNRLLFGLDLDCKHMVQLKRAYLTLMALDVISFSVILQ
ncbi:hypothetical protein J6590_038957, partial [Homalodisca vitripennis]